MRFGSFAVGKRLKEVCFEFFADGRTLTSLKRRDLLRRARGTLLRRATDPRESHESGIMNTLVPEPEIPSHQ
jgi:hypothetical protein